MPATHLDKGNVDGSEDRRDIRLIYETATHGRGLVLAVTHRFCMQAMRTVRIACIQKRYATGRGIMPGNHPADDRRTT